MHAAVPLIIDYPAIKPTLIAIGPFAIRWYALSYIAGLLLGWRYILLMLRNKALWPKGKPPATTADADDILLYATLGVVLGGRIGYILFYGIVYQPEIYLDNPLNMLKIWEGGMSFHGGLLGVVLGLVLLSRHRKLNLFAIGDLVAAATPIGLFFGRIANFINGELYGRPTTVPWAMIFPADHTQLARHPSQLYEAMCEGFIVFLVLRYLTHHTRALTRPGLVAGSFFALYGTARTFCEFFRDPEQTIGDSGVTMGMLLCIPMFAVAFFFIRQAYKTVPEIRPETKPGSAPQS
jgi:phosphatidylglycerol:prolipoprotein diacylglycerol transferase